MIIQYLTFQYLKKFCRLLFCLSFEFYLCFSLFAKEFCLIRLMIVTAQSTRVYSLSKSTLKFIIKVLLQNLLNNKKK